MKSVVNKPITKQAHFVELVEVVKQKTIEVEPESLSITLSRAEAIAIAAVIGPMHRDTARELIQKSISASDPAKTYADYSRLSYPLYTALSNFAGV
jgi:gamma-glutamylcysteine synthetase